MSKRNREKRDIHSVWRDYTSKLLTLLRTKAAGSIMLEESHMLGLIASSKSPEEHLARLHRYFHWDDITPTEPELLKMYQEEPSDALELWLERLQPSGITRQMTLREEIKADFEEMGKPVPPFVFGYQNQKP
jgi:hypothetical protein